MISPSFMRDDLAPQDHLMRAIVGAVKDGIVAHDVAGNLIFANDEAARLAGYASVEAMFAASPDELRTRFDVHDEHGDAVASTELPHAAAIRGEVGKERLFRVRDRRTGEESWRSACATLIEDAQAGSIVVTIFRDVTERKRTEEAWRYLARATEVLGSSLDYETTLASVAQLAVPTIADWCAVEITELGAYPGAQVAIAHVEPSKVEMARELRRRWPPNPAADVGAARVLRTGE